VMYYFIIITSVIMSYDDSDETNCSCLKVGCHNHHLHPETTTLSQRCSSPTVTPCETSRLSAPSSTCRSVERVPPDCGCLPHDYIVAAVVH
jgi:hypothetical protein